MKKITFALIFVFLILPLLSADVIILKNGKKYTGTIIEFTDGKYILKIKDKKYPIAEDQVQDVEYTDSAEQVQKALKGEVLHEKQQERTVFFYADAVLGYMSPLFSDYTDTIPGGMLYGGAAFGIRDEHYSAGLEFLYGSMSGSFQYSNNMAGVSTTAISSGSLINLRHKCHQSILRAVESSTALSMPLQQSNSWCKTPLISLKTVKSALKKEWLRTSRCTLSICKV